MNKRFIKNIGDLNLVVDYYDKSTHSDDTVPPEFIVAYGKVITSVYVPEDIINVVSNLLPPLSDYPLFPAFKKVNLENRLKEETFSRTNNTLKNMVEIYNNLVAKQMKLLE